MERERSSNGFMVGVLCFSLGLNLGNFIHAAIDDSDERVKNIQMHSGQIHEQLSETYEDLGSLVLNDTENIFTFNINQGRDQEQTCEGSYEVNNGIATAIGDIACTVSTPIETTTTTLG